MIQPQYISLCTSTIESAVYENRTYSAVRGRRLVTASYLIQKQMQLYLLVAECCTQLKCCTFGYFFGGSYEHNSQSSFFVFKKSQQKQEFEYNQETNYEKSILNQQKIPFSIDGEKVTVAFQQQIGTKMNSHVPS